jgi:hypothetical protein
MRWTALVLLVGACHSGEIPFDSPAHFKSGSTGHASDVTFTVTILPKLMLTGPVPEIEQAQIQVTRGTDHSVLQIDTVNKKATWGGVTFELGYADVYHDDLEITLHHAP